MSRRRPRHTHPSRQVTAPPRPPRQGARRRLVLAGGLAALVLLAASLWLWANRGAGIDRPTLRVSVLLITIDTLRADRLGCYGDASAATPVLDALAARGARFPTAIAHVPLTLPSHASILTG